MNGLIIRFYKKLAGVYQVHSIRQTTFIVGLSFISNGAAFLSCYFLVLGISMEISFLEVSGGMAMAGLLNMLPITIMGLGTRELSFLYVFQSFPKEQVLALSTLLFLVAQIGGGLIALVIGQLYFFYKRKKSRI